tara:strand:+ start:986 stop:1261 length:276 start_codon:yes stop_codon:yes gene_type:complete
VFCHQTFDYEENIKVLKVEYENMINFSKTVLTFVGIITFCVILWIVYKFAGESTEAIKQLSNHAKIIRDAKGIKEKKSAKEKIKKDPMFER